MLIKTIKISLISLSIIACSTPEEVTPDIDVTIPNKILSVSFDRETIDMNVLDTAAFSFTVSSTGSAPIHLEIDTIIPSKYFPKVGYQKGCTLTLNKANVYASIIESGVHKLCFYNPRVIGEYKLIVKLYQDRETTYDTLTVHVASPTFTVRFYEVTPSLFDWQDNKNWEVLNSKYSFSPLSSELKGQRCDTLYTEEFMTNFDLDDPSRPFEGISSKGRGIVTYINQDGGEYYYVQGNITWDKSMVTPFGGSWQGNIDQRSPFKYGFNAFEMAVGATLVNNTKWSTRKGTQRYELIFMDEWGKEELHFLTLINRAIGSTPREGNRLPD